ncbi:bifunctional diaminohydroxyphosphoribosylaminopyrimidine deaminase/5-amino-6-(5-phosphoribosylamino)uracil reductase RibD [Conchiformibius kuhniae]|uniref:Riboflavin biosynthesis protein RibD n=1 Tax=Conchiformibius kuhniae TaxID=211502 RepID=A0A8T9MWU6_9NEIS|nr:bifunctional diaminohydroxyphosphoribosylaminopyrimidine deaminase/5-amino-6-(5-phosphoribosylamino)uracil reductase RibD [Conchiformibius kuhniae]UOP04916.1 bifunctional diaminohydroxyphosphoribosylaminopyrimidine deaminase/5-amino-6-(5-phosphoribosylamino)uracil reductase RibD [Conchiformibius kuhniae]
MTVVFDDEDKKYMRQAIDLAWHGRFSTSPNPRVGCVVVRGGQVVGQGFHVRAGAPHAEVYALRQAGEAARGATAYVSLEPCAHYGRTPPCAQALIDAGVARVVAAMEDPNPLVAGKGLAMLRAAGIDAVSGCLEQEARALNRGFLSRIERGRPFVRLKIAASLDGKTALADGRSQWITGAAARADVQVLRAESCAVLTGIGTVLADNPRLNVRDFPVLRQPLRVVSDSRLRLPAHSRLLQDGVPTLIAAVGGDARRFADYPHVAVVFVPEKSGRTDLAALLAELAGRGIGELMVEAGATLNSAFLQADLADEIVLYQSPKLLGAAARGAFALPQNPAALTGDAAWHTVSVSPLGADIKWVLRRNSC